MDGGLTPEQKQVLGVVDRYARVAALAIVGVLALAGLYLGAIYLATSG